MILPQQVCQSQIIPDRLNRQLRSQRARLTCPHRIQVNCDQIALVFGLLLGHRSGLGKLGPGIQVVCQLFQIGRA